VERRIFIEGYDGRNWGDVLMALATLNMFNGSNTEGILPRNVAGQSSNYFEATRLAGRTRIASPVKKLLSFGWAHGAFVPSLSAAHAQRGDVVFYVNGYIFGDGWNEDWIDQVGRSFARSKSRGARVILMPQSFGPFKTTARVARGALELADLVFARDAMSFENVSNLLGNQTRAPKLHESVDYTGYLPVDKFNAGEKYCVVIPNIKILERKGAAEYSKYLTWLKDACRAAVMRNLRVKVMSHTFGKDASVISDLHDEGSSFEIVQTDPLRSRQIIAGAEFVISSRFHGMMNALTQNVPCAAIGWSHKYDEGMARYGMQEFNVIELDDISSGSVVDGLIGASSSLRRRLERVNRDVTKEYDKIKESVRDTI